VKKFIGAIAAAAILITGIIIIGIFMLGFIIKNALVAYVPKLTRTEVRISAVDLSFFPLSAEIEKLIIGNPQGFTSKNALSVASLKIGVEWKSLLTGDRVVIDRIEMIAPEINYEIIEKKDNLRTIIDNIKAQANANKSQSATETGPKKSGKKMVVKDFIVKNSKANLKIPLTGDQAVSAPLPDIHLKNLGENGASASEIFLQIGNAIYEKIRSPDVTGMLSNAAKSVKTGIGGVSGVIKGVEDGIKNVGEHLKGLFEK
jgi:uncharacterized protein involved in outer membrane biogenesis